MDGVRGWCVYVIVGYFLRTDLQCQLALAILSAIKSMLGT